MPKKLSTNTKSVEARARKDEKKRQEQERIEKEKEDEYWRDDDKYVQRKANRKEEREKKKQEQLDRKLLKKAAYEEEMSSLPGSHKSVATKVTRAEIGTLIQKEAAEREKQKNLVTQPALEENINRLVVEGEEARTVDEALRVLSVKESSGDRHPEKRIKAAYATFEEKMLPRLKEENPNLRLSQIKQLVKKEWMKSSENPMNQLHTAYNHKS